MWRRLAAGGAAGAVALAIALAAFATPAGAATLPTPTNVTARSQADGSAQVDFDDTSLATLPSGVYYTVTATASPGGVQGVGYIGGPVTADEIYVGGLTNGQTYTFTVVVRDDSGDGSASSGPSGPVEVGAVPDVPTNVTGAAGEQEATVSFQWDGNDGGLPLTGFTVTTWPGGTQTTTGPSSPIVVTGLTDGTTYGFTVTANNAIGPSLPSGGSNDVIPGPPPVPTSPPTITGDPQVDETVQASSGVWGGSVNGFMYEWYDCAPADPSNCSQISNATGAQYTVTSGDKGSTLEVAVTAGNSSGEQATATSAPTSTVTALGVPTATTVPAISGSALVDDTVHASDGAWTNGPTSFAYQWYDCDPSDSSNCVAITGATSADYTVTPDDGGSTLSVTVTADNPDNLTGTASTFPTATVAALPGAPVMQSPPTLGVVDGGEPVSATAGTWSNGPTSFTYEWISCTTDFSTCYLDTDPSSTLSPYAPTSPDSGYVLLLEVIASNAVGDSIAELSDPSAPVVFPPPTITVTFPLNGVNYAGSAIFGDPDYTCTPALGTQLEQCTDSLSPFQMMLPASLGSHSFVVSAIDDDGGSAAQTVTYTVVASSTLTLTPTTFHPVAPPPPPAPPPSVTVASPTISALRESSARWRGANALPGDQAGSPPARSGGKKIAAGTYFSFTTSEPAQLHFSFRRQEPGRRKGSRCVAQTRANADHRACTRLGSPVGFDVSAASAGASYVSFDGRVSSSTRLAPGSYTATVEAQWGTSSGTTVVPNAGAPTTIGTLHFTIVS